MHFAILTERFCMVIHKHGLICGILLSFAVGVSAAAPAAPQQLPPLPPGGMPMPSEEEMNAFLNLIESLPPEQVDELARIGEQIEQQMREQGVDLFGTPPQAPVEPASPVPAEKEVVAEHEELKDTKKEEKQEIKSITFGEKHKETIKQLLTSIIEHITSMRQKAASDEVVLDRINTHKKELDDLLFHIHTLNQEKHIKHFTEHEFKPLFETLQEFDTVLSRHEPFFHVEEPETEPASRGLDRAARLVRDRSKKALDSILVHIEKTLTDYAFIDDATGLVKKYEPEALRLKQEREQKAQQALKDQQEHIDKQQRSPVTPRSAQHTGGNQSYQRYDEGASYTPGYTHANRHTQSAPRYGSGRSEERMPSQSAERPPAPSTPSEQKSTAPSKSSAPARPGADDIVKEVKDALDDLDGLFKQHATHQALGQVLSTGYLTSDNATTPFNNTAYTPLFTFAYNVHHSADRHARKLDKELKKASEKARKEYRKQVRDAFDAFDKKHGQWYSKAKGLSLSTVHADKKAHVQPIQDFINAYEELEKKLKL